MRLWIPWSLLSSSTWSNSLITGNYPDASAPRHVLMFPPYNFFFSIRQCQVLAAQWRIFLLRGCSLLCLVVPGVWYHTASATLLVPVHFRWIGHGIVVRTLSITAGGRVALRLWGPRLLLGSSTWSNSLKTANYPAASAQRHVLMFPAYNNDNIIIMIIIIAVVVVVIMIIVIIIIIIIIPMLGFKSIPVSKRGLWWSSIYECTDITQWAAIVMQTIHTNL